MASSSELTDIELTEDRSAIIGHSGAVPECEPRAMTFRAIVVTANPSSIRFQIPKRYIENQTGVTIKRETLYALKGRVEGIHNFEIYRTVEAYVRVYVPLEFHERVVPGKTYRVRILSATEVAITEAQREILLRTKRGVPWQKSHL